MIDRTATVAGALVEWPTKEHMVSILRAAGLNVHEGRYSIRVNDCTHFVFQEYGGDLGEPSIDADAESVEAMMRDTQIVSDALARAGIRHRFEIYNHCHELSGYVHFQWPHDL